MKSKEIPYGYIICIGIAIISVALICIPDSVFEKKADKLNQEADASSSFVVPEDVDKSKAGSFEEETDTASGTSGGTLQVIEHENGYVQFNTVYGGTNYEEEYSELCSSYPDMKFDDVVEQLSELDLDNIFNSISYSEDPLEFEREFWVGSSADFTLDKLSEDGVSINEGVVVCAVVDDFYVVNWLRGSNYFIVEDWRGRAFPDKYFTSQMVHLGESVKPFVKTDFMYQEEKQGYTFIFSGAFKHDENQ